MGTQIISVDPHEVNHGDLIVGRMSEGPVERIVFEGPVERIVFEGPVERIVFDRDTWRYLGKHGQITTARIGGRVQVAREDREWQVLA